MFQPLNAKVTPPNYKFDLATFDDFMPEQKVEGLEKKYGSGEVLNNKNGITTYKYQVKHQSYQFPVVVQAREGEVLDFFSRLPSYFLHDIFLESLVKRLGKQDHYQKTGEEAFYRWEKTSVKHIYNGACTITCFPIFYTAHPKDFTSKGFTPLLEQMKIKK